MADNCARLETDLFSKAYLQTDVEDGFWDKIVPNTGFNTNNLVFDVTGTSEYIDLSETQLYVKCSIRKSEPTKTVENSEPIDENDKIGPINNFLHSLFSSASMQINEFPIENANGSYAYRSYIENLLSYSEAAKKTHLRLSLFQKDTAGEFDNLTVEGKPTVLTETSTAADIVTYLAKTKKNDGFNKRRNTFISNRSVEMLGPVHLDMMNVNKYLLNNTPFRITLFRSEHGFCLLGEKGTNNYITYIEKAFLFVRKVRLSPSIMALHLKELQSTSCQYPIRRVVVNSYSFKQQISNETINLYAGKMPRRLVLGLVEHSATSNSFTKNPFNFQAFGVKRLQLSVAGHHYPYKEPLEMAYTSKNYVAAYSSLFKGVNKSSYLNGNDISYDEYQNGNALYAFNLTPDHCDGDHKSPALSGQLTLAIEFDAPLDKSVTLIYYMEFDATVTINNLRQVITDFSV